MTTGWVIFAIAAAIVLFFFIDFFRAPETQFVGRIESVEEVTLRTMMLENNPAMHHDNRDPTDSCSLALQISEQPVFDRVIEDKVSVHLSSGYGIILMKVQCGRFFHGQSVSIGCKKGRITGWRYRAKSICLNPD